MLAAVMIAVLLSVSAGGFLLGAAVVARHRAQAAADLGAVAAAARVPAGPAAACAQAERLVARMGGGGVECTVRGLDVVVEVSIAVPLGALRLGAARALARAGPADLAGAGVG